MEPRTILVHLSGDPRHRQRLDAGLALARAHGAHLHLVFVTRPVAMPAAIVGRGASYAYVAAAAESARTLAASLEAEARDACSNLSWTFETTDEEHVEALVSRARLADLAVVPQASGAMLDDAVYLQLTDRMVFGSARPTLMIPARGTAIDVRARTVLVGWKSRPTASRALRAALPYLAAAERVLVASVAEDDAEADDLAPVVTFLSRHGISAELPRVPPAQGSVGHRLLALAAAEGANLLVIGAYGHMRLTEMVLGGVTRTIISEATIPVLMSH